MNLHPLDRFETLDTDRDGIGNYTDTDDDGDGFTYDANGNLLSSVRESGERTIYTNLDSKINKLIDPGVYNYYLQR